MQQQNTQKPEVYIKDSDSLEVHSIFFTLQGEGPFAGRPAIFIRLAGCNLQCPGCDTEYTNTRQRMTPHEIMAECRYWINTSCIASRYHRPLIVITGGEPFRQPIEATVDLLVERQFQVQIETNGTLRRDSHNFLASSKVTVVCSPKTAAVNEKLVSYIAAYKYVIRHESVDPDDGLPIKALDHHCNTKVFRPAFYPEGYVRRESVYVQPMDEGPGNEEMTRLNTQAAIHSCQKFGYTFCLQVHKFIYMP